MNKSKSIKEGKLDITFLAEHADTIRAIGKRVVSDVNEIGRRLKECKKLLGHGNWLPWLKREFGWTNKTAENFIRVHDLAQKAKIENFSNLSLPVSGLYLLAAPSSRPRRAMRSLSGQRAGRRSRCGWLSALSIAWYLPGSIGWLPAYWTRYKFSSRRQ